MLQRYHTLATPCSYGSHDEHNDTSDQGSNVPALGTIRILLGFFLISLVPGRINLRIRQNQRSITAESIILIITKIYNQLLQYVLYLQTVAR